MELITTPCERQTLEITKETNEDVWENSFSREDASKEGVLKDCVTASLMMLPPGSVQRAASTPHRTETIDTAQIRQVLARIEERTAHPLLKRGNSDLTHVRTTQQNAWYKNLQKRAFTLSFKGSQKSLTADTFEIATTDIKVDKLIGEGCRSRVYSGVFGGKKVAIKQLRSFYDTENAEKQARLVTDLEKLSTDLCHPKIVAFLGVNLCREDRTVNLVFEYMGGGTLEDFYDSRCCSGQMHLVRRSQVLSWCVQLFEGLIFLHDRKTPIIYRDLKPSNLILSADLKTLKMRNCGVSKTADLGVSIFAKQAVAAKREVKTDVSQLTGPDRKGFTGTKRYMAPECSGDEWFWKGTTQADIFSAALVMWFMAEGERPWERHHGHTAHEIAKSGRRPPLRIDDSRYPAKMAGLIGRCWAAKPEDRPRANVVLSELQDIAEAEVLGEGRGKMCIGGRKKTAEERRNQGVQVS